MTDLDKQLMRGDFDRLKKLIDNEMPETKWTKTADGKASYPKKPEYVSVETHALVLLQRHVKAMRERWESSL